MLLGAEDRLPHGDALGDHPELAAPCLEELRLHGVGHRDRVVLEAGRHAPAALVESRVEAVDALEEGAGLAAVASESPHVRRIEGSVGRIGDVEAHHGDRPGLTEQGVGGVGIVDDVGLAHRGRVAELAGEPGGAAHDDHLADGADDLRLEDARQHEVGVWPDGDHRDLARMVENRPGDELGCRDPGRLDGRLDRRLDVAQAVLAVHEGRHLAIRLVERRRGARVNLRRDPEPLLDVETVAGSGVERGVAVERGDSDEVDRRGVVRHQKREGVIDAEVDVEDDLARRLRGGEAKRPGHRRGGEARPDQELPARGAVATHPVTGRARPGASSARRRDRRSGRGRDPPGPTSSAPGADAAGRAPRRECARSRYRDRCRHRRTSRAAR